MAVLLVFRMLPTMNHARRARPKTAAVVVGIRLIREPPEEAVPRFTVVVASQTFVKTTFTS